MANDVQDVSIKLKPELDAAEYKKQMSQIAKESKTAAEQAFKQLDTTMKASLKKTGESISRSGFLEDFVNKMRDINQQIRETGNLPDKMSTKLYQARQNVIELDEQYKKLLATQRELVDTGKQYVTTDYYEKMASNARKAEKALADALQEEDKLLQQQDLMRRYRAYERQIDPSKYKRYNTLMNSREALIDQRAGTASIAELEKIDEKIKGIDTALRTLKKDSDVFREMREIEGQLTFEATQEGLKRVSKEIGNVREKQDGLRKDMVQAESAVRDMPFDQKYQLSEQFKRAETEIEKMETKLVVATERVNEMEMAANKTAGSMSAMRNAVWAISRVLGNVYTIGLDIVRMGKMIANTYKRIYGYIKQLLAWFKKLHSVIKGTEDTHKKSWKQMLRDILRYSFGIRSLFMLFRRLRRYIKEAFEAMAEQIPEVNALLNELKASLGMLKGSLATAFEPILSAVAPALLRLIDLLARAITYIGMFFAAFTGRGYVYKATKAIQGMAGAAKELNKQLQGFDELNNLTSNNDSGSGSGPLAMFEKMDVPDWIKKIVDFIKKVLAAIWAPIKAAWDKMKDYVLGAWKRAASIISGLALDILRDFLKAWQKWGEPIFTRIFQIVGDIGMIVGNIALSLRKAWNANENGYKIWDAILHIVYLVVDGIHTITQDMIDWSAQLNLTPAMTAFREWLESCAPVAKFLMDVLFDLWDKALKPILTWTFDSENSGVARLFRIFRDFNKKVDWEKLRNNVSKLLEAFGTLGQTIGEGLLKFIEELSDNLAGFVNSGDFEKLTNRISAFFNSISYRDVKKYLDQIWRIIKNIAKSLGNVIAKVWSHKDAILNALEFASEHLETIFKLVAGFKLTIDFARLAANIYLMVTAIAKASASMAEIGGVTAGMSKLLGALTSPLGIVLTSLTLIIAAAVKGKQVMDDLFNSAYGEAAEYAKITDNIQQSIQDRADSLSAMGATDELVHDLVNELESLQSKTSLSNDEQNRQRQIVSELNSILPDLNLEIDEQTNKLNMSTDAILANVDALLAQARTEAAKEDLVQISKDQYEIDKNLYNQRQKLQELQNEYNAALAKEEEQHKKIDQYMQGSSQPNFNLDAQAKAIQQLNADIEESITAQKDLQEQYNQTYGYITYYNEQQEKTATKQEQTTTKTKETKQALEETATTLSESTSNISTNVDNITGSIDTLYTSIDDWSTKAETDFFAEDKWASMTSVMTDAFKGAFDTIILNTDTQMQTLYNTISQWVNNIALMINELGSSIDNISNTLTNIPSMPNVRTRASSYTIPHLATGAVIPPNREFLAVLGDQKRGTNIESPLSTMVEAFNMANKGGNEQELALLQEQNELLRQLLQKELTIGDNDIFKSVRRSNKQFTAQNGYSAFA